MRLGDYLKELRRSQRLTLAELSATAGVSLPTLSRWETGAFQPRLSELEATLRALGAAPAQWERALSLVEAPRAVARLRQEAEERQADLVGLAGHAPTTGDLLRAMRLRRRMTVLDAIIAAIALQITEPNRHLHSNQLNKGTQANEMPCHHLSRPPHPPHPHHDNHNPHPRPD